MKGVGAAGVYFGLVALLIPVTAAVVIIYSLQP
jgi:hypothetical protein